MVTALVSLHRAVGDRSTVSPPNRDASSTVLSTGLDDLDRLTGGGRSGEVWLVGGPHVAATTLALGLARAALRAEVRVAWLSTWQEPDAVTDSVLLAEAGVLVHRARDGVLTPDQAERLSEVTKRVQAAPVMSLMVSDKDMACTVAEQAESALVVGLDHPAEVGTAALDDLRDLAERIGTWVVVVLPDLGRREVHGWARHAHLAVWVEVADPETYRVGEADLFVLRAGRRTPPPVTVAYQDRFGRFLNART